MFAKLLIANRGEIACRIARTARRLGLRTVAVHSDADAGALHVAACDEAVRIGPAPARESYLRIDRIVDAARRTGVDAVHPGYGFLSENADFAEALAAAGRVFVGPPAAAIRAMGSKADAKRLMEQAGVPLVPGYHGVDQDDAKLAAEARRIGWPVLIKASAGGGGKGMRIVDAPAGFAAALVSARREAAAAFGDERVLVERYLLRPRHVEIQVFADAHGQCIHLFERDCSVQRRHQKVIEEAPAPGMDRARRAEMGEAAIAAARAVGYVGAGTVEFIVDEGGAFYFMEMNTRLQVEHPVTEMITGLDLVEWQLRVAAGERLPRSQDDLGPSGHAIEARIYAEDPDKGFLPSIGRIVHLREPETGAAVRIDTGVRQGDEITQFYDPMIAKLIVHAVDRDAACAAMVRALGSFEVAGVATNVDFLRRVIGHPAFASGAVDTGLIERHRAELTPAPAPVPDELIAIGAGTEALVAIARGRARQSRTPDPHSPWTVLGTWWLNTGDHALVVRFVDGERPVVARVRALAGHLSVGIGERVLEVSADPGGGAEAIDFGSRVRWQVDGRTLVASVVAAGETRTIFVDGVAHRLAVVDPLAHAGEVHEQHGHLLAPMSGTVVAVLARVGDRVEKGQQLVVVEAMKMEHALVAPAPGIVEGVFCAERSQVSEGAELIALATEG